MQWYLPDATRAQKINQNLLIFLVVLCVIVTIIEKNSGFAAEEGGFVPILLVCLGLGGLWTGAFPMRSKLQSFKNIVAAFFSLSLLVAFHVCITIPMAVTWFGGKDVRRELLIVGKSNGRVYKGCNYSFRFAGYANSLTSSVCISEKEWAAFHEGQKVNAQLKESALGIWVLSLHLESNQAISQ